MIHRSESTDWLQTSINADSATTSTAPKRPKTRRGAAAERSGTDSATLQHEHPTTGPLQVGDAVSVQFKFGQGVRRYRGRGVVWELWNEPNGHQFWPGGPNASAYAALALALGREMRAEPALRGEVLVGPAASQVAIAVM